MLRRKWFLASASVLLLLGLGAAGYWFYERRAVTEPTQSRTLPEAPPDLAKFRQPFAAGLTALEDGRAADAVEHFGSFSFGSRAAEEYRLYYLGTAHERAGNAAAARAAFGALWRRNPRMVHRGDAAMKLAGAYGIGGDWARGAEIAATVADRDLPAAAAGAALWVATVNSFAAGNASGVLYNARKLVIKTPRAPEAAAAAEIVKAMSGTTHVPLTPTERLERAVNLLRDGAPREALAELDVLRDEAPQGLQLAIQLNRGLALHHLRRFEESNAVLEPLASGYFKYAIPAIYHAAKNYGILSASINPIVIKTVIEKKRVGTVKVRVGKGKKRRLVTRPKFANVKKNVQLIDLAKKAKKDEYDRLAVERLKDLLLLPPVAEPVRLEVLNALIGRAEPKNQDTYLQELVREVIKISPSADPGLQRFWDKGWAAYGRGDLGGAKELFRFIADTYTNPNVRRQAEYWLARVLEREGKKEEATSIYQRLAAAPYTDLYALNAQARGATPAQPGPNPLTVQRPDWTDIAERDMPKELRLAYELTALSAIRDARLEIQRNARLSNQRFADALLADIFNTTGHLELMYRSIRRAFPKIATVEQDTVPSYFLRMYYPIKYREAIRRNAQKNGLDPHLVSALILQESLYNPRARSRVGATGLMQLMPATGAEIARQVGTSPRLEDPDTNIRLGTIHLRRLINMFSGNTQLAVASYNAGQGNV
ncbi:MAG TPA: transglycosylase SLT domain-containing protein, partial [Thermoanaerobaculia bacterium]|nr:transglycosylase SLT domain-containing protein [Thermoanaerobaculia bacterium]